MKQLKKIEKEFGIDICDVLNKEGNFLIRIDRDDISKLTRKIWLDIFKRIKK